MTTLQEAGYYGRLAAAAIQAAIAYDHDRYMDEAADYAEQAASYYHEGVRERGECPECGSLCTDPWGGLHYNSSLGCCVEPPEPDGECFRGGEAAAYEREQMAHIQRTLK